MYDVRCEMYDAPIHDWQPMTDDRFSLQPLVMPTQEASDTMYDYGVQCEMYGAPIHDCLPLPVDPLL